MHFNHWKARAGALRSETLALYFAWRDPRTPLPARAVAIATVAYALSPLDLIPDFIPVIGLVDDLILIPAGIALAIRLIPQEVMADARRQARDEIARPGAIGWVAAAAVALVWLGLLLLAAGLAWRYARGGGQ